MIQFAVVIGESPIAVEGAYRVVCGSLDGSRLFEGERLAHEAPGGVWAAAAISAADPTCSVRLSAAGDSIILLNGPAFGAGLDRSGLAESARHAFSSGGSSAVAATLGGTYNFVGVAPTAGLRAFTDFSGLFPLYWYQGPDVAIFSNRCTALAAATTAPGWDLRALAWIIGHANLFGERMPTRDVSYLPPGCEARVDWGGARVRVDASPEWIWPPPSEEPLREDLTSNEWDRLTEMLLENLRMLEALDGHIQLMLSGGKDSRLCLALAKAAGLQERIVCITNGAPDGPEVTCAGAVAEAAGFRHELGALPVAMSASTDSAASPYAAEWRRLRQHVYRYEGIVCPRDGVTEPASTTTLSIKGFGGELYRGPGGHAKQFKRKLPRTLGEMATMFVDYHQQHDPLGVLLPDESSFQAEWLRSWVYDSSRRVRSDVLPEKFYVDYRIGHWNGPLGQATPADIKLNPLVSRPVAMKYMELSPRARATDRLHFEVMRRTAPELLGIPILNDVWAFDIANNSPIELPSEPFPSRVEVSARTLRSRRWSFLEDDRAAIEQLFEEAQRDTDMGEICNMEKLKTTVRAPQNLRNIDVKAVESSIAVALALLGRTEAVLDRP